MIFDLFSCQNIDSLDKYKQALPDSNLINEVISSVIKIDSLKTNYKIHKIIIKTIVYNRMRTENDSVPPPPPIPFSIGYDNLFKRFESETNIKRRTEDSIFISLQTDTTRKFEINTNLYSRFNHSSDHFYLFYQPIFSYDKQYVFVQYWYHCGGLCGSCQGIILKWSGKEWVKKFNWCCGIS